MSSAADSLRAELTRISLEHSHSSPTRPVVFPSALIHRVVAFVRQQARLGQSLAQCSQQLGVPRLRLHYWVYKRQTPPAPDPFPSQSLLRPVQVCSSLSPLLDGVAERRYTLRSPAGWQVQDLRLSELVELLRSLG